MDFLENLFIFIKYILLTQKIEVIGSCDHKILLIKYFKNLIIFIFYFYSSHIPAGDELCWDYNYQVDQVQGKEIYCQCNQEHCRGRLL